MYGVRGFRVFELCLSSPRSRKIFTVYNSSKTCKTFRIVCTLWVHFPGSATILHRFCGSVTVVAVFCMVSATVFGTVLQVLCDCVYTTLQRHYYTLFCMLCIVDNTVDKLWITRLCICCV